MIEIEVDESLRKRWTGEASLAVVYLKGLSWDATRKDRLEARIDSVLSELQSLGAMVFEDPMLQRMRATFRAMPDMDPSRYRPASEALIRRCLDKGLFRISPLVDTNNILSIQFRVPLGIYNVDSVTAPVWTYRVGIHEETYHTISGQVKSAEGKLVIADKEGVIGSPVADSGRAAIRAEPDKAMVIAYLPLATTTEEATRITQEIEATFISVFEPAAINRRVLA